jgi:hypothetical protein
MAGHTPGPWTVGRDFSIIAGSEEIAALYTNDGADDSKPYPVEANARLIAAAPELLEALKDAVDGEGDMTAERIARWRAAIAKAEGG